MVRDEKDVLEDQGEELPETANSIVEDFANELRGILSFKKDENCAELGAKQQVSDSLERKPDSLQEEILTI